MMFGRSRILAYGLPVIAAAALLGAVVSIATNGNSRPRVEPRFEPPSPVLTQFAARRDRPIAHIGAVGMVEPSSQEIKVGTEVSGTAAEIFVVPGAKVKRGEPLFALNAGRAEATLAQRRGDVATAKARLALARSRVTGLQAEVQVARTAMEAARVERDEVMDLVRMAGGLNAGSTISEREITRRNNLLRSADAKLAEMQGRLAVKVANLALFDESRGASASIAVELASVEQAQNALKLAETDLDLRTIRAPEDGTVLQVNLRPGEFAQAGALSQGLVILGQTEPLHLRIDIDEADISRYRPGAPALASERGRARRQTKLSFVRVEPLVVPKRALSGQATERVDTRVMQVLYAIQPEGPPALIGQQFDVFIEADQLNDTEVSVASSAPATKKIKPPRDRN
jgi:multidrug resistance efflux pump